MRQNDVQARARSRHTRRNRSFCCVPRASILIRATHISLKCVRRDAKPNINIVEWKTRHSARHIFDVWRHRGSHTTILLFSPACGEYICSARPGNTKKKENTSNTHTHWMIRKLSYIIYWIRTSSNSCVFVVFFMHRALDGMFIYCNHTKLFGVAACPCGV